MSAAEEPTKSKVEIEEVAEDSDDEVPELEEAAEQQEEGAKQAAGKGKQTRQEKKARRALAKHGLKPVSDITRVTIKKAKTFIVTIENADVLKAPNSDTYVVFGAPDFKDLTARQNDALQQMQAQAAQAQAAEEEDSDDDEVPALAGEEEAAETPVEAGDVEESDIELVMQQANVSRERAIRALKEHPGDFVKAFISIEEDNKA